MSKRKATVVRNTLETQIELAINIDGTGEVKLDTPIPFLNHMLEQIGRHGLIDIDLSAKGDVEIDLHHTVEDIGITLGQAINKALGNKKGINRYGFAYVPLDEALSRTVVDFSGRPGIEFGVKFPGDKVGKFDTELFFEFFQGFSNHAMATLHIDNLRGRNSHHIAETIFKAFGRALRMAVSLDQQIKDKIPSTKGSL